MMYRIVIGFMVLLCGLKSQAQERTLSVALDREQIMIGEQVRMEVTLTAATPDTVTFPVIPEVIEQNIEVISKTPIDTQFTGEQLERRVLTQSFFVTSFDSGYFAVSPLYASINGDSIASNPFLLAVQTLPIDTAKGIADIKDIRDVPFAWKEWFAQHWYWIVGILAVIAALTALLYYLRNRPKSTPAPVIDTTPKRPAYETALEALAELKDKKYWQQGEVKRYYIELSNILRAFLEGHFHIHAMEQTSDEILHALQHQPDIQHEQQEQLRKLFFLADLVKFAKEKPLGHENDQNMAIVETFIRAQAAMIKATTADETAHKSEDHG